MNKMYVGARSPRPLKQDSGRGNPAPTIADFLVDEINILQQSHLYRKLRVLEDVHGIRAKLNEKDVTLFCGNDYLGLSQHPAVIAAFQEAAEIHGVGSGASRLISGTSRLTEKLENRIAQFKRKERALVFSSGYHANLGIIPALVSEKDLVIVDKLNHASIIDGCKLSGATMRVYPHKDLSYLEKLLKQAGKFRRKLIVTDSVFSMDGDLAPLPGIVSLKEEYGAMLMIDEAHGTGVFGANGRGVAEYFGVEDKIDVTMGTMSKAIGTLGGFVAGDSKLIDYLINKSRPFIFSTALPPAVVAASLKSLELIENEPALREKLWENVAQIKRKDLAHVRQIAESPIVPIMIGSEERALQISENLLRRGFLVPAVRYPTVPKGKARLRVTISALHDKVMIDKFIAELQILS